MGFTCAREPDASVTRLAPSPTGALHLGNARTFLINWALARRNNWKIILRIEDLDGPRVKPEATASIMETLRWLGIDWDEGPLIQSADLAPYRSAMERLAQRGLAYPSALTRTEIEEASEASAPQEGTGEIGFPSALRPRDAGAPRRFEEVNQNWRFVTPHETVEFTDVFAGPQRRTPAETIGDFVLWTRRAQPAYQLAVVVDDSRQQVTHVVRADDLLDSAARQILLYRALGLANVPAYLHLPLVVGADGRRLAKRHGDSRIDHYRARGVSAERIIALLGRWSGIELAPGQRSLSAAEFAYAFDLARLPPAQAVFTAKDDQWLQA
ncbi:tRNA glutamyl-Q(34) synthetase GluQRS [soil metagenome]